METKSSSKLKSFMGLVSLYVPYKRTVIAVALCSCLSSLSSLVYPYITKYVINDLLYEEAGIAVQELSYAAMSLLGLFIIETLTHYVTSVKASVMVDNIYVDLQEKLFDHYQRMTFSYFDNNNVGGMITTIDKDTDRIRDFVYDLPTYVIEIVASSIGAVIVFSCLNGKLMAILLPLIPLLIIFQVVYSKSLRKKYKNVRAINKEKMEFVEDRLSGIRTTISFGNESIESQRFREANGKYLKASTKKWVGCCIFYTGSIVFNDLFYGLMVIVGGYFAVTGKINIADLVVFYMYSYMITNPIAQITRLSKEFQEAFTSYQAIVECLGTEPEITNPKNSIVPDMNLGDIAFHNVTFSYGKSNESVLTDINLTIHKGEYVAIAGPSGAGKSTIAGLIPRYYDVTSGSISVGGINIKDIKLNQLRREIGMVQQDIYLFNGTVMDNIAYAKPDATLFEVREAAKKANADEFISKLPNGYNSEIGERGVKLSGGQKQRIAIARLFLMDPSILIFDEATSALDNESEKLVQEALEKLAKNRTTIVIAHRLTTIQNADRILFLTKNGIEEEGTHEQLMKQNGMYAKLYNTHQLNDE
jgi:ATP-binding cassette subfamily B protein